MGLRQAQIWLNDNKKNKNRLTGRWVQSERAPHVPIFNLPSSSVLSITLSALETRITSVLCAIQSSVCCFNCAHTPLFFGGVCERWADKSGLTGRFSEDCPLIRLACPCLCLACQRRTDDLKEQQVLMKVFHIERNDTSNPRLPLKHTIMNCTIN